MIATDIVDVEQAEGIFLKNMAKFPDLAFENLDNLPSCFFEEELFSHDEFRRHLEKTVYERLGIKLNLRSSFE